MFCSKIFSSLFKNLFTLSDRFIHSSFRSDSWIEKAFQSRLLLSCLCWFWDSWMNGRIQFYGTKVFFENGSSSTTVLMTNSQNCFILFSWQEYNKKIALQGFQGQRYILTHDYWYCHSRLWNELIAVNWAPFFDKISGVRSFCVIIVFSSF